MTRYEIVEHLDVLSNGGNRGHRFTWELWQGSHCLARSADTFTGRDGAEIAARLFSEMDIRAAEVRT